MNRIVPAFLSAFVAAALGACSTPAPSASDAPSPSLVVHTTNIPDFGSGGEPPPHDCDRTNESGKVVCRIVIHVFASTAHPGFVCDTFNDYRAEVAKAATDKVKWVLVKAMKGDPFDYEFDANQGVLITDKKQNFRNRNRDARDTFSWEPVPSAFPAGDLRRRSPYEMHIKRSDGKECYPNDPIIVNEG